MASSNLIKQLQERGLVAQVTDEEALAERLAQGPVSYTHLQIAQGP